MAERERTSDERKSIWARVREWLASIRARIIFPYLVLTFLVAVTGTAVTQFLVTGSHAERLHNQLKDAARVTLDSVADFEEKQLALLRQLAYTKDLPQALARRDAAALDDLARGTIANAETGESYILFLDEQGELVLGYERDPVRREELRTLPAAGPISLTDTPFVREVLQGGADSLGVWRVGLVQFREQEEVVLLFFAGPVREGGDPYG
ncbi:MAG: hypothetical protein D6759_06940, partial [Chloroflexi bacterium]